MMTNLVLAVIGIFGIMMLCGILEVIRVWKEVLNDET